MKKLKKLRYTEGGPFPYAQAGEIAGSLFDAVTPTNSYGVKSDFGAMGSSALKSAGSGAAIGTMIAPGIGTVVGGVIGAGIGAFQGKKKNDLAKDIQAEDEIAKEKAIMNRSLARLSNYDSVGSNVNQIYAKMGGRIKYEFGGPEDPPNIANPKTGIIKFSNKPVLSDSVQYSRNDPRLLSDPDLVYGKRAFEKDPSLLKVTLANTPEGYTNQLVTGYTDPSLKKISNVSRGLNPYGSVATYTNGTQDVAIEPLRKEMGGTLPGGEFKPLSTQSVQIDGNAHSEGGVKLGSNVEVEGGETIKNDFVFSKVLGFADLHKPIAKAIGKMEKKPLNNVTNNTIKLLKAKEEALKIKQESLKEQLGIKPMPEVAEAAYGGFMNVGAIKTFKKWQ